MDCRPRGPLQLAGEDGSSKHWEECFDAGEEWLFDADADAVRPNEAFDDAGDADCANADCGFKPNCLGIDLFIRESSCNAERGFKIQTEHLLTPHSRAHSISAYQRRKACASSSSKRRTAADWLKGTRTDTVGSP